MLDYHSEAPQESSKWIEGDLVEKKNVYILDKQFAACFDGRTLVAALEAVVGNYGLTVNLS